LLSSGSILHMSRSCDDSKVEMRESPLQALRKIPATAEEERTGREDCVVHLLYYNSTPSLVATVPEVQSGEVGKPHPQLSEGWGRHLTTVAKTEAGEGGADSAGKTLQPSPSYHGAHPNLQLGQGRGDGC